VLIVFCNAGGVVFYADTVDAAEDVIALGKALQAFIGSGLARRLAVSLVEIIGERIPGLINVGARLSALWMETELDMALITD
jgi:hypothetical protein